jgi:hypothetical protein
MFSAEVVKQFDYLVSGLAKASQHCLGGKSWPLAKSEVYLVANHDPELELSIRLTVSISAVSLKSSM